MSKMAVTICEEGAWTTKSRIRVVAVSICLCHFIFCKSQPYPRRFSHRDPSPTPVSLGSQYLSSALTTGASPNSSDVKLPQAALEDVGFAIGR